jgi:hypothetical protein
MKLLPHYDREVVEEWWAFLDRVRLELPAGTVIAAKDFGRLAYFTGLQIVDLAGITDPRVRPSRQEGELPRYLQSRGVTFVLAPPQGGYPVHREIRRSTTLVLQDGFPVQEGTGYLLYRAEWP